MAFADHIDDNPPKVDSRPLPPALSHYTTLQGFMGIVEKKEIWASNVIFLNDQQELLYGLNAAERVIERFLTTGIRSPWHDALRSVRPLHTAMTRCERVIMDR